MHPWVNYDQILQKCFIGRLVISDTSLTADDLFGKPSSPSRFISLKSSETNSTSERQSHSGKRSEQDHLKQTNNSTNIPEKLTTDPKRSQSAPTDSTVSRSGSELAKEPEEDITNRLSTLPKFDWIQKLDSINIIFYTKAFSNPLVEIYPPKPNQVMMVCLTYEDTLFEVSIFLNHFFIEFCFFKFLDLIKMRSICKLVA